MRVAFLVSLVLSVVAATRPSSFQIDVPYIAQINDYTCGDASYAMVAQFYNRTLDQRSIVDVSRTTPSNGTFSEDIVRAALFSNISSAASRHFFPDNAPLHGWSTSYSLGFAGFGYRNSSTCWLDSLKNVIAAGFPVIVLQWYSDLASDGGHFRVVTGYDDTAGVIITNDPWDRDGQAPVMKYSDQEFCKLWNYTEVDDQGRTYAPYFAQLMMPWPMTVQVFKNPEDPAAVIVHVEAVYPCVEPFCATAPNATDVVLTVTINGDVIFTAPLGDWVRNIMTVVLPLVNVHFLLCFLTAKLAAKVH
eukprot:TRINITY_DN4039_c0_g1_i2.p1 TRINITY_DN4039_c0_g1~~TRINITY_DN4039_c0_g1_i2.p1  ORF type:complete len:304 (+),score=29.21 TRINITY_DN4039_c0_g1_i2:57-968(+)